MTPVTALVPHEPLTLAGAELRASYRRSRLYDAFCFFREHAGYCAGSKAAGALALAKAEEWARAQRSAGLLRIGWKSELTPWEPMDDGEPCPDSWEYCFVQARPPESVDEHDRCTGCERDTDDCRCSCRQHGWRCVASLGGIGDADADYRRVVEAELALDAMDAV